MARRVWLFLPAWKTATSDDSVHTIRPERF